MLFAVLLTLPQLSHRMILRLCAVMIVLGTCPLVLHAKNLKHSSLKLQEQLIGLHRHISSFPLPRQRVVRSRGEAS